MHYNQLQKTLKTTKFDIVLFILSSRLCRSLVINSLPFCFQYELVAELFQDKSEGVTSPTSKGPPPRASLIRPAKEAPKSSQLTKQHRQTVGSQVNLHADSVRLFSFRQFVNNFWESARNIWCCLKSDQFWIIIGDGFTNLCFGNQMVLELFSWDLLWLRGTVHFSFVNRSIF